VTDRPTQPAEDHRQRHRQRVHIRRHPKPIRIDSNGTSSRRPADEEHGFIDNGRLRDELLNETQFTSLAQVRPHIQID